MDHSCESVLEKPMRYEIQLLIHIINEYPNNGIYT